MAARSGGGVFEALVDAVATRRGARELAEAFAPLIFDPRFESELARMWSAGGGLAPDPRTALHVRETVARYTAEPSYAPHAVITTAPLRPLLAEFLERSASAVAVYAFAELPPEVALEPVAVIGEPVALTAAQ